MEFRILGPLEVDAGDRRVELGGQKPRALLAVLLLHANEVVSADRLIDDLWGLEPPATAAKTLRAHVSRLRRALDGDGPDGQANGLLETRGNGYLLRVEAGRLDADVFQGMLDEARAALAGGHPERASEGLRNALALWRGPALADFAYESFAQTEIARLEELRLSALEERIDADLAIGRVAELVPELEALVATHPLRERLRGQLMLALYRADRQAEALQVYQQGRRALAEELGLEPSQALQRLERQILEQDEAVAGPPRPTLSRLVPARARRHPVRLALVGGAVLAAAVVAAVVRLGNDDATVEAAGAVSLDPASGETLGTVPLGTAPSNVAIGEGSVWVLDADDRTVSRIDPESRTVERTFSTASTPTDIAIGAGSVWIGNGPESSFDSVGPVSVSRLDPESGVVVETIALPPPRAGLGGGIAGLNRQHLAATHDAIWAIGPSRRVSRIDPRTNRLVATVPDLTADNISAGDGDVWVAEDNRVAEIDPSTNAVSTRIEVGDTLSSIAVGAGSVWAADPLGGSVWRIDPSRKPAVRRIPLDTWVAGVAFGEGAVWATNEIGDEVYRIDPHTNGARVVSRATAPRAVDAADGTVWVTASAPPSHDASLPDSICSRVFYEGAGEPRLLLVSDLPLKGPVRSWTEPMVAAVRLVLAQRGFEAGGVSIGYQSCDASTSQAGSSDLFRCGTNGKAYARNLAVVGVIGSFQSFCSFLQIPIAGDAPAGPLAMISTSNTYDFLTMDDTLYPTGRRNFVRIAAPMRLQAAGLAQQAKELGKRRLFVVWPAGDDEERATATDIRTAAAGLGVTTVGFAGYNSGALRDLARKIARTKADAVVIADDLSPESGPLVRTLRSELGTNVALLAPDGYELIDELLDVAGPAAEGMYISTFGLLNSRLTPRGARFLEDLEAASGRRTERSLAAAYAAQATEILLDAIARSDGTRASVTRELLRTRVEDGLLGDLRFDARGDLVEAPVTILRVVGKGHPESEPGYAGAVVDRVVIARGALLRDGAPG